MWRRCYALIYKSNVFPYLTLPKTSVLQQFQFVAYCGSAAEESKDVFIKIYRVKFWWRNAWKGNTTVFVLNCMLIRCILFELLTLFQPTVSFFRKYILTPHRCAGVLEVPLDLTIVHSCRQDNANANLYYFVVHAVNLGSDICIDIAYYNYFINIVYYGNLNWVYVFVQ